MDKQKEALRVAEELLADIELNRLKASEAVMKASRVARLIGHEDLIEFLECERNGYPTDGSAGAWVDRAGRRSGNEGKFYPPSIAKVEASADAARESLKALQGGGNYSGEMLLPASNNHDGRINGQSAALKIWNGICGQVISTIYDMVLGIYHELLFSDLQSTLFSETQTRVDRELAVASGAALSKIESVSDRLRGGDPESVSQALTTCRRLIDSCADHLFPARDSTYDIGGQPLKVGQQNVLNRLQSYVHSQVDSKGRRDRLRRTLQGLYDRCSSGTHAEVTVQEARFVFLQTYVALGEILTLRCDGRDVPILNSAGADSFGK